MPAALVYATFAGIFLGGLRSPLAWTPFAAALWLAALAGRFPLDRRALKAWAPWLAWLVVSAALAAQPLSAPPVVLRWASFALLFAAARASWGERERRLWLKLLWVCAPVLGAAALFTGARALLRFGVGNYMTGFLPPYYNYTAFVEAAALASLAAELRDPRAKPLRHRGPAWAACAFLAAVLVVSRSRGGLVAAAIGFCAPLVRRRGARRLLAAAAGLALVAGLAAAIKLEKSAVFKRPEIWRSAVAVAADHPLSGEGPGGFENGFLRHNFRAHFRLADYLFTTPYAHSEVFQVLAETGLVGLLLLFLALSRSFEPPDPSDASGSSALAALGSMAAFCLYDNMIQIPAFGLLLAGALAAAGRPRRETPAPAWARRAFCAAGLALALAAWLPAFLAGSARAAAADEYGPEDKVELLRRAERIYPADASIKRDLAFALLGTMPPRPELALAELKQASRLSPTNAVILYERARLLESLGRLDEAEGLAARAVTLEPEFFDARLMLAEGAARRGDKARAGEILEATLARRAELEPRILAWASEPGYARRVCALDARRVEAVKKMIESREP